jgi:hypothetical protein
MAKKKKAKPVPYKMLQASETLGISLADLELALEMLEALKKKMSEWEDGNGLSEEN